MYNCPVRSCKMPIEISDMVYDEGKKVFGMVVEYVPNHGYHWIVEWQDGRKNWVDDETVVYWKRNLIKYRNEMQVVVE